MNVNGDKFNPFKAMAENAKMREKLINEFAEFLAHRARTILAEDKENAKFFQIPENRDWLMDQIDALQEQDEWNEQDASRLSSMYFFLLTSGSDSE